MADDGIDVERATQGLRTAMERLARSALEQTLVAQSLRGAAYHAVADRLLASAHDDLADYGRLAAKVIAVGGEPSTTVAPFAPATSARQLLDALATHDEETVAALHAVIPHTGQQPASEALEHLLEHAIMRKQDTVDWLRRLLAD